MAATDERAIHEFPTGTIDENSLLIMDRPTLTPGEYETEKFAIANLGLKLLGGIDFPSNLDTEEQDIFGAINEVNAKAMNIAAEYDETASYSKGDYCIYQNATYRCIKASGSTTGTFVAADWTLIKVLAEVKANTDEIGLKQNVTDNSLDTTSKTIVGAINELNSDITPLLKEKTQTVYCSNGARIWIKRLGNTVQVEINESSQMTFSTSWANVYTDNTYQTRAYLDSDLIGTATALYVPIGLVNGHQIIFRIEKTNRAIQIICDVNTAIYPQGSGVYTLA